MATAEPHATADVSQIRTRDGLLLSGWHHRLARCRARIVLVHGYGEHARRYDQLVAELLAAGYECHLFDLRGHGVSEGKRGHVPELDAYRDDLARFAEHALREGAGAPAVLLGHSLGGLIALSTLLHRQLPFAALVLSSPFLAPVFDLSSVAELGLRLGSLLLPSLSIAAEIDPEGLSRDGDVVAAYREDPQIVRTVTLRWGAAVLEAQEEVLERAGDITLSVLLLLGSADPIAEEEGARAVFERLGSTDKMLLSYGDYRHEVFNELGRERVLADLLRWLDDRFPAPRPLPK